MKQLTERGAVKFVAKLSPWLAPIPSAFFVGRSSITHLALPWLVAVIVAAIVETLGLATVHTALWLSDWNHTKRKVDPSAPTVIALGLGAVYLVTTLGLIVALEVWPDLATYAPALFPLLAVVGTVNLALIANQERREAAAITEKAEQRQTRQLARQERQARQSGATGSDNDATGSDNGATTGALVATVTPLARQAATMAQDGIAIGAPIVPMAKRGTYAEFAAAQMARNGNGSASAGEVVAQFNVPKRTAYRWAEKFRLMNGNGHGHAAQAEAEPQTQEVAQ